MCQGCEDIAEGDAAIFDYLAGQLVSSIHRPLDPDGVLDPSGRVTVKHRQIVMFDHDGKLIDHIQHAAMTDVQMSPDGMVTLTFDRIS